MGHSVLSLSEIEDSDDNSSKKFESTSIFKKLKAPMTNTSDETNPTRSLPLTPEEKLQLYHQMRDGNFVIENPLPREFEKQKKEKSSKENNSKREQEIEQEEENFKFPVIQQNSPKSNKSKPGSPQLDNVMLDVLAKEIPQYLIDELKKKRKGGKDKIKIRKKRI